jgi:hypothetical protein
MAEEERSTRLYLRCKALEREREALEKGVRASTRVRLLGALFPHPHDI